MSWLFLRLFPTPRTHNWVHWGKGFVWELEKHIFLKLISIERVYEWKMFYSWAIIRRENQSFFGPSLRPGKSLFDVLCRNVEKISLQLFWVCVWLFFVLLLTNSSKLLSSKKILRKRETTSKLKHSARTRCYAPLIIVGIFITSQNSERDLCFA